MRQRFDDLDRAVDNDAGRDDSDRNACLETDPRLFLLLQQVDVIAESADQEILFRNARRVLSAPRVRDSHKVGDRRHDYGLAIRDYRVALYLDLRASCVIFRALRDRLLYLDR